MQLALEQSKEEEESGKMSDESFKNKVNLLKSMKQNKAEEKEEERKSGIEKAIVAELER